VFATGKRLKPGLAALSTTGIYLTALYPALTAGEQVAACRVQGTGSQPFYGTPGEGKVQNITKR